MFYSQVETLIGKLKLPEHSKSRFLNELKKYFKGLPKGRNPTGINLEVFKFNFNDLRIAADEAGLLDLAAQFKAMHNG